MFFFFLLFHFSFFDYLMEEALKRVILEYVRAMLNKWVSNQVLKL